MPKAATNRRSQLSSERRDEYREMANAIIKDLAYRNVISGQQIQVLGEMLDELAYRDI